VALLLGELDLHLFNEGTHRRLWEVLGARVLPDGAGVRFSVWAPDAQGVSVVGDFNNWEVGADELSPQASSGVWAGDIAAGRAGDCYKLAVRERSGRVTLRADPMARRTENPPSNASVVDESTYVWGDAAWVADRESAAGTPSRPLRIYEVHLGSWRPEGGVVRYRDAAHQLAEHVLQLGFTHVELLPVAEHPFGGSWGYQVTGYYSPTARYGSPDELRYLIDTLHQAGIGVIIDWVPAHFPRDDWALARFDGTALYEHADPRQGAHPDWGTLVFNYGRHEVRNFLVANALYWMHEFHVDGLRVDAVASMLYLDYSRKAGEWVPNEFGGRENLAAIGFLQELNTVVFGELPGAMVIAEESTSWPQVTAPVHHGGLGFSHKWNMGWMHDTLGYVANDPVHRRWHHRELTFGLLYAFTEQFVLPLSHDEVVHGKGSLLAKMPGDDWQRFANLRALYGWMWALPGAPLVFMGAELAPWTEWSESTGLPWYLLDHPSHRGVRDLVATLNHRAADWPPVWERDHEASSFRWLEADNADESIFSFVRWDASGHRSIVCIANFTPVPRPGHRIGVPWPGDWDVVVDTDAPVFGGSGSRGDAVVHRATTDVPWQDQPASLVIDVPPLATVWLGGRLGT
jgi:1,4-alpha-glucan branching enzyme